MGITYKGPKHHVLHDFQLHLHVYTRGGPDGGENNAFARVLKWILDHGGVTYILSWGKIWLSVQICFINLVMEGAVTQTKPYKRELKASIKGDQSNYSQYYIKIKD